MPNKLIHQVLDLNWLAEQYLNRCSKTAGMFVCRGRVQLSIAPDAIINPPHKSCYIGIALLGAATPRNDTTVISCATQSALNLNGATIGRGAKLSVGASAQLTIDSHSYVNDGSRIAAQTSVSIGKNCAISFGVTIFDDDGHGFGSPPYSAPIVIEDDVWIGCNAIVLKGVTIGKGSVVAAGAVVSKSCPPGSLLAGVPACVVRKEVCWTDELRMKQQRI